MSDTITTLKRTRWTFATGINNYYGYPAKYMNVVYKAKGTISGSETVYSANNVGHEYICVSDFARMEFGNFNSTGTNYYPKLQLGQVGITDTAEWTYLSSSSDYSGTVLSNVEITFMDGTDCEDTQFINWVSSHGTQIDLTYNVTFNTNGGSLPQGYDNPKTVLGYLPNPLPTCTKSGHVFKGWYTDSSFTTSAVAGAEINDDTNLYAKFEDNVNIKLKNSDQVKLYPQTKFSNLVDVASSNVASVLHLSANGTISWTDAKYLHQVKISYESTAGSSSLTWTHKADFLFLNNSSTPINTRELFFSQISNILSYVSAIYHGNTYATSTSRSYVGFLSANGANSIYIHEIISGTELEENVQTIVADTTTYTDVVVEL